MSIGAAFREAWRDYRRSFRELWLASALLSLPLTLVVVGRGLVAAHVSLPFSASSEVALGLVDFLAGVLTPAAVALLAADRRAGGTWGLRAAWMRALRRAEPVLTGRLAASFVVTMSFVLVLQLLERLGGEHRGPLWTLVAIGAIGTLALVASSLFAVLPLVTSIGRVGGFKAVGRGWRLLARDLRHHLAALGLAQAVIHLPFLIIILVLILLPPSGPGSPWAVLAVLIRVYEVSAAPFLALVALSVYCDATGAGDAKLRAELDAP